ncbi:hypothetical protein L6452_08375 [Arctium lappa]|uniref:Uncharacterized protein n=1 Tax=Arctium lappa TaxID=4217 RepID=A0ACB9DHR7_ARCLA|nr:hypothetical protein L6452_08375 [Arctium lappa]
MAVAECPRFTEKPEAPSTQLFSVDQWKSLASVFDVEVDVDFAEFPNVPTTLDSSQTPHSEEPYLTETPNAESSISVIEESNTIRSTDPPLTSSIPVPVEPYVLNENDNPNVDTVENSSEESLGLLMQASSRFLALHFTTSISCKPYFYVNGVSFIFFCIDWRMDI